MFCPNSFYNLHKLKNQILKSLLDNGIILNLNNVGGERYFTINDNCPQFNNRFIIPIYVERDNQSINIDLVFRLSDFYLQGFSYNTTYYHFSDSTITSINGQTPINLNFDSNYNTLIGGSDPAISWSGIEQSFNDLINYGENPENNYNVIRGALARVILATAESMRFRQVRENIERTYNQNTQLSWRSDFYSIITNWSRTTNQAINYLREHGNSLNGFIHNSNILIFTAIILNYLNDCKNTFYKSEETCYEVKMRPLEIYYNDNHSDLTLENFNIVDNNRIVKTFNLGQINPLSYNKIKFLANDVFWTKNIWGDESFWENRNVYWGEKTLGDISGYDFKKIIRNYKYSYSNIDGIGGDSEYANNIILDKFKTEKWGSAWFEHLQSVGFTFYWENDNYYLQFLSRQHANSGGSASDLKQILKVGNRIILYND